LSSRFFLNQAFNALLKVLPSITSRWHSIVRKYVVLHTNPENERIIVSHLGIISHFTGLKEFIISRAPSRLLFERFKTFHNSYL